MGRLSPVIWIAIAMLVTWPAGAPAGPSVQVTPARVDVAPGQPVRLTARVSGAGGETTVRWKLFGPRVAGANWGQLVAAGASATYVAPPFPPPGPVIIEVHVLGGLDQPLASVAVPVRIGPGLSMPQTAPPRARPPGTAPPVVAPTPGPGPSTPGIVVPTPETVPSSPGIVVPMPQTGASPSPPAATSRKFPPPLPPLRPPYVASEPAPTARPPLPSPLDPPAAVAAAVKRAARKCRAGDDGAADLRQAERIWTGLDMAGRVRAVGELARDQIGGIPLRVRPPSPRIPNIARVFAADGTMIMAFGTDFATGLSILNEPLTERASPAWGQASLLDFVCYASELVRIRSRLDRHCLAMYDDVKVALDASGAYAGNARDAGQAARQITAYETLMAEAGRNEGERMATSWLFERIAAERGRGSKTCDMPFAAGGRGYAEAIAGGLRLEHETLAARRGRAACACSR